MRYFAQIGHIANTEIQILFLFIYSLFSLHLQIFVQSKPLHFSFSIFVEGHDIQENDIHQNDICQNDTHWNAIHQNDHHQNDIHQNDIC